MLATFCWGIRRTNSRRQVNIKTDLRTTGGWNWIRIYSIAGLRY